MRPMNNEFMRLSFDEAACGPRLVGVTNKLTNRSIALEGNVGLILVLEVDGSNLLVQQTEFQLQNRVTTPTAESLCWTFAGSGVKLSLDQSWTLAGAVVSCTLRVRNGGSSAIRLRDVVLLSATTREGAAALAVTVKEGVGDPGRFISRAEGAIDANPVFLQDCFFVGIDWPVAENRLDEGRLTCRQFPGVDLAPGAAWSSRSLSFGVSATGQLPQAFLKHLDVKRGRPTRRASFYFDWLTHATEGPTQSETHQMLDLLAMLKREHGVHFDIYALDDGAVETRWELMFDRHQLRHRLLYPQGVESTARRAKELGIEMGIWLGPDVIYRGDKNDTQRREDILAMVRDWNVGLFKLDVCVSWPLKDDPYYNDWYMTKLEELYAAARAINPNLVVINHRIRFSPYMLTILDSTLWESAESYAEVVLGNSDKPRLYTRFGAYQRGEPSYFGAYSPLLEDHGMCFNGDWRGWRNEFVLGAFGRALALSPEIYGTLFLLPDNEYAELGRLMKLADENRTLLGHTRYVKETGDFIHSDGNECVVCMVNDSWQQAERSYSLGDLGLPDAAVYQVELLYPLNLIQVESLGVSANVNLRITLPAFGIAALKLQPVKALPVGGHVSLTALTTLTILSGTSLVPWREDGRVLAQVERVRFAADTDVLEHQTLKRLASSRHPEVNACRAFYAAKQRRECTGIAAHAWDGDETTVWGDDGVWRYYKNIWRLDLGAEAAVGIVEIRLSQLMPGPVLESGDKRGLTGSITLELSNDLVNWESRPGHVFYRRRPVEPDSVIQILGDFGGAKGRYLRIHARGFHTNGIVVHASDGTPLLSTHWHGNNMLTVREPAHHAALDLLVGLKQVAKEQEAGRLGDATLAVLCNLGLKQGASSNAELALAWLEQGGVVTPLLEASPMLPAHRWEWDCCLPVNSIVFRLDLPKGLAAEMIKKGQVRLHVVTFESEQRGPAVTMPSVDVCVVPYRVT